MLNKTYSLEEKMKQIKDNTGIFVISEFAELEQIKHENYKNGIIVHHQDAVFYYNWQHNTVYLALEPFDYSFEKYLPSPPTITFLPNHEEKYQGICTLIENQKLLDEKYTNTHELLLQKFIAKVFTSIISTELLDIDNIDHLNKNAAALIKQIQKENIAQFAMRINAVTGDFISENDFELIWNSDESCTGKKTSGYPIFYALQQKVFAAVKFKAMQIKTLKTHKEAIEFLYKIIPNKTNNIHEILNYQGILPSISKLFSPKSALLPQLTTFQKNLNTIKTLSTINPAITAQKLIDWIFDTILTNKTIEQHVKPEQNIYDLFNTLTGEKEKNIDDSIQALIKKMQACAINEKDMQAIIRGLSNHNEKKSKGATGAYRPSNTNHPLDGKNVLRILRNIQMIPTKELANLKLDERRKKLFDIALHGAYQRPYDHNDAIKWECIIISLKLGVYKDGCFKDLQLLAKTITFDRPIDYNKNIQFLKNLFNNPDKKYANGVLLPIIHLMQAQKDLLDNTAPYKNNEDYQAKSQQLAKEITALTKLASALKTENSPETNKKNNLSNHM